MKRFTVIFLVAAWVVYFATRPRIVGGAFLALAGLYAIVDIIQEVD